MTDDPEVLWLDGELVPASEARLDPRDRGFTLGDGLFETMRAREGRVRWLDRHLARLRTGAAVIGLSPLQDDAELGAAVARTLAANDLSEAAVRLTVSRGVPTRRGLLPDPQSSPSLVVQAQPFSGYPSELYARGMRAVTSRIPRNERSPLANVKALGYLDNVLARREAADRGADEALMLNATGRLVCASAANLFLVLDDTLITPSTASGALPGIMRELVVSELAPRQALRVAEREVRPGELAIADEAFLTNALLGIMPLSGADGVPVGAGAAGPVNLNLRAELERLMARPPR